MFGWSHNGVSKTIFGFVLPSVRVDLAHLRIIQMLLEIRLALAIPRFCLVLLKWSSGVWHAWAWPCIKKSFTGMWMPTVGGPGGTEGNIGTIIFSVWYFRHECSIMFLGWSTISRKSLITMQKLNGTETTATNTSKLFMHDDASWLTTWLFYKILLVYSMKSYVMCHDASSRIKNKVLIYQNKTKSWNILLDH